VIEVGHALLICTLLLAPSPHAAHAQTTRPPAGSTVRTPQKDAAETVFAKTASKIVFLITRKSGEVHSRASGVILSADGYIATNYHALQGADAVEVRYFPDPDDLEDYQSFNGAKLLYADRARDIAVLKINSSALPFLKCSAGTGCEARVGEKVYAIGNPMGLSGTMSEGIVSGLRSVENEDVIQHTAPISPGSSGGALVDSSGALLGMNAWQVTAAQNLNFAISAKYLLAALALARQSTKAVSFPPDVTAAAEGEDKAWQASQPAVAALRGIANAIKECPVFISEVSPRDAKTKKYHGPLTGARVYFGPPINVVWDAIPSGSVRSPYAGWVEFTVPRRFWVPDDVYEKYKDDYSDVYKQMLFKPTPSLKIRYEFDVGPGGLQLTRTLERDENEPEWKDARSDLCWDQAAQNGQTAKP